MRAPPIPIVRLLATRRMLSVKKTTAGILVVAVFSAFVWANWPPDSLPASVAVDRVVIEKGKRELSLYHGTDRIRTYRVSLGRNPVGPKAREGDRRTPEGRYTVDSRKADSAFHRALHISYPSRQDTARAAAAGVSPGGDIMIHGIRNDLGWIGRLHRLVDWTSGCIAVTDPEIEQLWRAVPNGTPIEIRP